MKRFFIINSRGEKEPFSWRKIYLSAQRVGAPKPLARKIADEIKSQAYPGITTREIFQKIRRILLKEERPLGIRYNLKEAIRRLGPTGFPFEKYVAKIFSSLGYYVLLNQFLSGKCVFYEIDFLAKKKDEIIIGECKFHRLLGGRVDLKVGLINYARHLDLLEGRVLKRELKRGKKITSMVVTNTRFTSQLKKYAHCVGIDLLGWRYPQNQGLEFLIEKNTLYPITILPSLKRDFLSLFAQQGIMLVQDLLENNSRVFFRRLGISPTYWQKLQQEARLFIDHFNKDRRN